MSPQTQIGLPSTTQPSWPRLLLLVTAAIETMSGLSNSTILFADIPDIPGPGLGGLLIKISLALHPLFAAAALIFISTGWVYHAVVALALVLVIEWMNILPSVRLDDLALSDPGSLFTVIYVLALPVLAIAATLMISRHPDTAGAPAVLLAIPTLASIAGVAAFAIGVMIYGF